MRAKLVLATTLTLGAAVWGCQSILGIEDLSEEPRPLLPDAGGQRGSNDGGPRDMTGSPGGSMNQGGNGGSSPSSEVGVGGLMLADGGTADAFAPGGPITVSGRIIDFFRQPVPDAPVTLGAQSVLTNDDGEFTFTNVTPPYDVSLIAQTTRSGFGYENYAYVYQGLTRSDPTLQVYSGRTARSTSLAVSLSATFDDPNRGVIFAFSSPDGRYVNGSFDALTTNVTANWRGPATTTGAAHGLLVLRSGTFDGEPPLTYEAYDSAALGLSDDAPSNITLDVSPDTIPSATVSGTVDEGTFGSHTNLISLRFSDGTVMPLLDDGSSAAEFSYQVPILANSSLIVAASAGINPYAIAHADGIAAAANQSIALTLPRPVTPSAPPTGSDVGPGTTFSWSTLGQSAGVYVWHLESGGFFEGIYVITSRPEVEFPSIPNFTMNPQPPPDDPAAFTFYWALETHGDYASVDAATGPDGFFDSFSFASDTATGPARGSSGYFTESEIRYVNLAEQ